MKIIDTMLANGIPNMNAPIVGYFSLTVLTVAMINPPIIAFSMNSMLLLIGFYVGTGLTPCGTTLRVSSLPL